MNDHQNVSRINHVTERGRSNWPKSTQPSGRKLVTLRRRRAIYQEVWSAVLSPDALIFVCMSGYIIWNSPELHSTT